MYEYMQLQATGSTETRTAAGTPAAERSLDTLGPTTTSWTPATAEAPATAGTRNRKGARHM